MTKVRYALALILLFIPLVVQAQSDPPDTPQNVKVTVGNAKLTLTWQAPSSWGSGSARGYQVDWYSGPAAPAHTSAEWQRIVYDRQFEASATETSFTFSGNVYSRVHNGRNWIRGHHAVANGNQYHLRLRAGSTKPGDPTDILVGNWVTVSGTPQAVLSTNADLGGLTASSATSSGGPYTDFSIGTFGATKTTYTASVANDQTHVKLTPTVADTGKATVGVRKGNTGNFASVTSGTASGPIALDAGANAITVRVTAEDGSTIKDYTVTVTRAAAQQTRSANANLGALTAGSATSSSGQYTDFGIGTFEATTTTYTASVANDRTHVKVTATVADTGKATVGVRKGTSGNFDSVGSGSASSAIALDVGSNALVVRVTAEDGSTTKDYTVTVTRALAAPTGLRVTAGDGKLDLSWTAPSGTLTGYDVHYTSAPASGAGSVTNSAAVQTVSAAAGWLAVSRSGTDDFQTISGLSNDQAYRVRVRAKNASGAGAWVFGTGTPRAQAADPAVTLSASPNPVTEGSSVTVTATLSAAASSQVTIPVTITDNSAEPEDHGTLTGITIASGATSGTGPITTNQDADDQDETFTVALGTLPSGVTAGSVTSVQVRIRDDEGVPAVTLSASPNPVTEGSSVTVTATLSAAASSSVTIPVTITDNSAEPEDHGTLTGITIASGATGGTGTIATNEDTDTEDETFTVALGALPSAVTAGSPGSVQIRIADDDRSGGGGGGGGGAPDLVPGFGTATVADQSYIEGTQIPALMLPEATGGDGALTYRLAPEPPSGLVLNAGTRTLTGTPDTAQGPVRYTWTARDADGDEAPLSFTIAVAAPTAPSSLTLEADPAAPAEGGDDVTVTARLDAPAPSGGVAVTLTLSGTASGSGEDADYTLSPTMIEIAAGKTEGTAVIAVIDDAADDDGETIVIDASSASPALTAETLELVIADNDEPDLTPSFGDATVAGQSYVQGTAIAALTLPAATGGDGVLTYGLTPEPPSGLSLDEDTRTLTGTPDTAQGPVRYTWTVRDADGDEASLSFTIAVVADLMPSFGGATVAGQSYVQGTAITALTLPAATGGDGALTYRLTPEPPSGLVLDAATRMLTGTPDTAQGPVRYTWTVRDADGDEASLSFTIAVVADLMPSFGGATVAGQSYVQGTAIAALTLPAATGGDGVLTYRLTPEPPSGLSLDEDTRTLTGTPDAALDAAEYTWTVRDADGDEASLSFTIAVVADLTPSFGDATVAGQSYVQGTAIAALTLPAATGGDGVLTYGLTPEPPSGLSLDEDTRTLTGTPDTAQGPVRYTWTVRDADGDEASLSFTIAVVADLMPSFGGATVAGQSYVQGTAIAALTLPAATGGDGVLTYRLTPEPPSGLVLDAATRMLTGTPDAALDAAEYTWTVRDADGDEASLSFTIAVVADLMPSFGGATVAEQSYVQGTAIAALTLPAATGGDGVLTYRLTPEPPSGLSLDEDTRTLTGTPDAALDAAEYTWTVRDADGDEASLSFTIAVVADLMPSFGGAAVAGQSYVQGTAIAALTLPAATGGDGALTYSLTPEPPSGLSLDEDTRTLTGTPDAALDAAEYTWTVRDADGDEASLSFTITVVADLMPSFGGAAVAGQSYVQGTAIAALTLPAATGGDGALTYRLTPEPPSGLVLDAATRMLTGTPDAALDAAEYTWTARDADGDEASLSFTIAVAADPRRADVKEAVRQALAAAARRAMAGALDNIGARFGDIGASGLSLAGQWVPLEGAGAGVAAAEDGGLRRCASARSVAGGTGSLSGCAPGSSRGVPARALLGASAFSLHAGSDGSAVSDRALWSVWGRGDLGTFEGRGAAGVSYDGELRTGWLGVDARSGPWVAGLAVSRGTGEADYGIAGDGLSGRLETELTSVHPYGRWTFGDGLELRGVLGGGTGDARHEPDGGDAQTGDLSMRMASVGVRHALSGSGGVSLAFRADGSVVRMETEDGPEVIHGLSADGWRLRAGLEASTRLSFSGDASLEPFFEASARRDGGDGLEGSGVELAGGLRWVAPGVSVEMRGRWLAAHSAAGAEEAGASVTARAGPGSDGRGLFLSLSPRWGAALGGARALWNEEMPQPSGSGDEGAVDARVGYGFGLPGAGGVVTPFAEAGLSGGDGRRLRVGTRFGVPRASFGAELSGAVDGRGSGPPSHAVRLELQLRF